MKAKGIIRSVTRHEPLYETPKPHHLGSQGTHNADQILTPGLSTKSRKRAASPVSISEAAERARLQQNSTNKKRRSLRGVSHINEDRTANGWDGHNPGLFQSTTPTTPDASDLASTATHDITNLGSQRRATHRLANVQRSPQSPEHETQDDQFTLLSISGAAQNASLGEDEHEGLGEPNVVPSRAREHGMTAAAISVATATPPIADTDLQPADPQEQLIGVTNPPILPSLITTAAQDISLPSPSLSPITAAHNFGTQLLPYNMSEDDEDNVSTLELGISQRTDITEEQRPPSSLNIHPSRERALAIRKPSEIDASNDQLPTPSLMDIPMLIDSYEAMPAEMQTYVLFQLLRRSAKSTLHVVADAVNPALKIDFLTLFPLELSLNIIRYLDAKSLCRAAQVSRRWRQIIDSDERVWKQLFDEEGFVLPEGELRRAIKEGWGWQPSIGSENYEKDLSLLPGRKSPSPAPLRLGIDDSTQLNLDISSIATGNQPSNQAPSRPRRKVTSKYSTRKHPRRKESIKRQDRSMLVDTRELNEAIEAEGPYAAAAAAAEAVTNPPIGLSSLRNLHLYKSIYRRHHLVRQCWMQDEVQPQHIAFRAHDRHVVTCLQFDTEKIITGSDDTNINVYETKTGKLRKMLAGHEGGVWALQYYGNVLVSGSTDRSVRVWDIEAGRCTQVFQGHTSTVRCLQILMPTEIHKTADGRSMMSPKQPLVITGSRDSNLRVWRLPQLGDRDYMAVGAPANDADCPYFVRTLTGHHHSVRAIAAHGDTLVSGSYDCTVRVWKISTGETVHRLLGHTQKVYSVVLDHERNRCISGSMDTFVKVWNLETGQCLFNLEGHTSLVGLLDLSYDRLVSAAADSTLRIWDPENGQCKSTLTAHTGAITCFQHDWQKVISGSDRTLKMWDVKTGECVRDLLHDLSGVWQVKFNARRCVAAVQRDNLTYIEVRFIHKTNMPYYTC